MQVRAHCRYANTNAHLSSDINTNDDVDTFMDLLSVYVLPKTDRNWPWVDVELTNTRITHQDSVYVGFRYPVHVSGSTFWMNWPAQYAVTHLRNVVQIVRDGGKGLDEDKLIPHPVRFHLKFENGLISTRYGLVPDKFMPMEDQIDLPDRLRLLSGKKYTLTDKHEHPQLEIITSPDRPLLQALKEYVYDEWHRQERSE